MESLKARNPITLTYCLRLESLLTDGIGLCRSMAVRNRCKTLDLKETPRQVRAEFDEPFLPEIQY